MLQNHFASGRIHDKKNPQKTGTAPLQPKPDETLDLRIFLDKCMLEVFANGRQCITQQIFPTGTDDLVGLCAKGDRAKVLSLDAWDMAPAKLVNNKSGAAGP